MRSGEANPQDFKFISGYSGWGPQQLEEEVALGMWFPAKGEAASKIATDGSSVARVGELWLEEYVDKKWKLAMQSIEQAEYSSISQLPVDCKPAAGSQEAVA